MGEKIKLDTQGIQHKGDPSLDSKKIGDYKIFQAFSVLENKRGCMEPADREWFIDLMQKEYSGQSLNLEDTKGHMLELYEKYKNASTARYKKIEPLDIDALAGVIGNNQSYAAGILSIAGLEGVSIYENHVGNYKPMPLLRVNGKDCVLKSVEPEYIATYKQIQKSEHRPPVIEVSMNGKQYGLFEFKGEQVMDFTDKNQLRQLCEIGIASSKRNTKFDNNPGNLLVNNSEVFYIDQGLTYSKYKSTTEAIFENIREIINTLPRAPEMSAQLVDLISFIIEEFKKAHLNIKLEPNQDLDTLVRSATAPLLNRHSNEDRKSHKRFSSEVEESIISSIKSIVV